MKQIQRVPTSDESKHPTKNQITNSLILPHFESPPSFQNSLADAPPSYVLTKDLARAHILHGPHPRSQSYAYHPQKTSHIPGSMMKPDIDFGDTSDFKQAPSKKAKKASKAASKWDDNGNEGSKDGGDGGEENGDGGGAGGGGNNNGDGGGGDDGGDGGGDDWNDWDTGKKKKKGKKAKEEEEKKKQEEEDKKKEEVANGTGATKLDWTDDANGNAGDDWGGFMTTSKKKKDKKNKVWQMDLQWRICNLRTSRLKRRPMVLVILTTSAWTTHQRSSLVLVQATRRTRRMAALDHLVVGTPVAGILGTAGASGTKERQTLPTHSRNLRIHQMRQILAYGTLEEIRRTTRRKIPLPALILEILGDSTRRKRTRQKRIKKRMTRGLVSHPSGRKTKTRKRKRMLGTMHLQIQI